MLTDKETNGIIPTILIYTGKEITAQIPATKDSIQIPRPTPAPKGAQAPKDLAPPIPMLKAVIKTARTMALPMPTLRIAKIKIGTPHQGRDSLKDADIPISGQALQTEGEFGAVPE